jgi:hypothetical protein
MEYFARRKVRKENQSIHELKLMETVAWTVIYVPTHRVKHLDANPDGQSD